MSKQKKDMVRNTQHEVWNKGNLDVVDERFASDYVGKTITEIQGPEGAKQFVSSIRNAFPDFRYTIQDTIAEDDKVVIRWQAEGTHRGEFQGVPPTGEEAMITGISIFRLDDGKFVEGWTNADLLGLMQQLGAAPTPEQA